MRKKTKPKLSFQLMNKKMQPMNDLGRDSGVKERLEKSESHHLQAHHKL